MTREAIEKLLRAAYESGYTECEAQQRRADARLLKTITAEKEAQAAWAVHQKRREALAALRQQAEAEAEE